MVDYSRWQNWEKETEQQEVEEQRLRELYELQQTNPEKIEELKTDLQKLKENVQQEATNAIPQRQAKEVTTKLRTEAKSMKEKLKKLLQKLKEQHNMEQLIMDKVLVVTLIVIWELKDLVLQQVDMVVL